MRLSVCLLPALLLVATASVAATGSKGTAGSKGAAAGPKVAATGPKVHASRSKDITACGKTQGGVRTVAGLGLGALVGSKVIGGSNGILAGAAVSGVAGEALDRQARCGPKATIESNAAADDAPKDKKINLKGMLGL